MFTSKSSGNKRTRKYKLIYYLPELLTICYLVAYGIAEHNYYSNPSLAELAREGLTTRGHWTESLQGIALPRAFYGSFQALDTARQFSSSDATH